MMQMFGGAALGIEGANATVQPVNVNDVALAILNCLKMPETIGQTYDLGKNQKSSIYHFLAGPTKYKYSELYELLFNMCNLRPYVMTIPLHVAYEYKNYPMFGSFWVRMELLRNCLEICLS